MYENISAMHDDIFKTTEKEIGRNPDEINHLMMDGPVNQLYY